ncbi:EIN3-binding F-box protein [Actinidia chinensis var. chinensis]|uniref:EIN3-binding F-box protein n=1 Tax=Actinidia chinensis var. chinensis TaxID=1590841 RepID=A0A2R6Q2M1_ACTCC|nr:EIN3-binding F-box protein [Actinidia chinensis var. chinensis]
MSKLFEFSGDLSFCLGGSIYPNPKDSSHFFSLCHHADIYLPPRKRSRIEAPLLFSEEIFEEQLPASIEVLPDECLFEVFRHLPGGEERSICACVSKKWLMLLSSIHGDEICTKKSTQSLETEENSSPSKPGETLACNTKDGLVGSNDNEVEAEAVDREIESDGYLSRCLEGKKATDIRLAAIAIGTGHRGGLGKLSIRGSHSSSGVTNLGLRAIARCCPSLRVLSLWNVSSVGDEGLYEIAKGCPLLEKLDLCQCPAISDKALLAIAKNCPNLTALTIESCSNIGNGSLQAVGSYCRNLTSVSIKKCSLVGDQGIASLLSSASCSLTTLKLQALTISDVSLAVIGHYGKAVTDLVFCGLENVSERGFWVMGNGQGLQKLRSITITSCQGVTDVGLEAVGKGCPNLKKFCLRKCAFLTDNGLVAFAKAAVSLESLQLEECHRITQCGFFGVLVNCGGKLKALGLANCLGFKDLVFRFPLMACCTSLHTLSIHNCPGFGNFGLTMVGKLCPQLQHVDLNGLNGITDEGLLPLIENCEAGLSKVSLSGCVNLTDKVVSVIAKLHGVTLEELNLDGCKYVTDSSLVAVAENCSFLRELDVSKSAISDFGVAALACAAKLNLQILSLSGCSFISDKSFPYLMKLGRTLVGLNIQNCSAISSSMVDLLVEHLWRCDILS